VTLIEKICRQISEVDPNVSIRVQHRLNQKTKPLRSLGRLEDLACEISSIRGLENPALPQKVIVVMAGDHGVVEEGVSAYPQEVTCQMVLNFAKGGAAINVLARQVGAKVVVVDMGMASPLPTLETILSRRIGSGTRNFTLGPAMTREQALSAIEIGIQLVQQLHDEGTTLIGLGEMGIGNTTSSSALLSALLEITPEEVTGYGTGIDSTTYARKIDAIKRAIELNAPNATDPIDVLTKLGGFEIAGLVGVAIGCAAKKIPIVMDGFISSVAALLAVRIEPKVNDYLIASHRSVEIGHGVILKLLKKKPLFELDMRLGEGTGAALAMGWIDASLRILEEMATFESAGVNNAGPKMQEKTS